MDGRGCKRLALGAVLLIGLSLAPGFHLAAQPPSPSGPSLSPLPAPDPACILKGPILTEGQASPHLAPAQPEAMDKPLPINLATALRLAGARPLAIAAAQASVQTAAAELARTRVAWLPSLDVGAGYYHHDGAAQGQSGNFYSNTKDQFMGGAGLTAKVATTDALFAPLAARQLLRAREIDVQTARNDALMATAVAYFNVQEARGRLAATQDVVDKALALRQAIDVKDVAAARPTDLHRARVLLDAFEDDLATAREQWRLASADLTEVLRLDPTATVAPLEPPDLRVTLISPQESVDILIPIGLTNRPELASQQALVQAALARIRQERMRPLVPSLILQGGPGAVGPGGYLMAGVFASGANGAANPTQSRDDVSVALVWELQNLGLGNRALVRERRAEQQELLVELFHIQDTVAAEIARAHTRLASAAIRVNTAEDGVQEARLAYEGSLEQLGQVDRKDNIPIMVRRAFDVIDALRSLSQAYGRYFLGVNDYNRAQFQLYRALGYPAGVLACERSPGPILPVDTTRPPPLAPVCVPDPGPHHP